MNAIILSAGQGKRLMPLTTNNPKCLVNIEGLSLIEWQINELIKGGIEQISVVVGYQAEKVAQLLHRRYDTRRVHVIYNPTYAWADNLFSCWVARAEMEDDFILLNGDTLFEEAALHHLLQAPVQPVTVATYQKQHYDADDMKVSLDGNRLVRIGKDLAPDMVDGESIGMLLFRREGPALFRHAVDSALRDPSATNKWYLSVIDEMAQSLPVWTCAINGFQWCEVDFPADLIQARKVVQACESGQGRHALPPIRYAWG